MTKITQQLVDPEFESWAVLCWSTSVSALAGLGYSQRALHAAELRNVGGMSNVPVSGDLEAVGQEVKTSGPRPPASPRVLPGALHSSGKAVSTHF